MKIIILALALMVGCSKASPAPTAPDAKVPTVGEMCAMFRNTVCGVLAKCDKMEHDDCEAQLDSACEKVTKIADQKKFFESCLPELEKVTCDNVELPESCNGTFN